MVLTSFLLLLAVRAYAQAPESATETTMPVESVAAEVTTQPMSPAAVRAEQRAAISEERSALRQVRGEYLANLQEQAGDVPEPALSREQRQRLQVHVDAAASGMRASLENAQRVARDLTNVLQRLGSERSVYAQSGIDTLAEVSGAREEVSADIVEFANLANLMLKTDDPQVYMEDVRAYAELIAQELELMREAIFEAAQLSRENI